MRGQRPGVRRREYCPLHQVLSPAPAVHRDNPYLEWNVEDVVPCREHRVRLYLGEDYREVCTLSAVGYNQLSMLLYFMVHLLVKFMGISDFKSYINSHLLSNFSLSKFGRLIEVHHATQTLCHHVRLISCQVEKMYPCHIFLYHHISLTQYSHDTMSGCHHVTIPHRHHVRVMPYSHDTTSDRHISPCHE